MHKIGEYHIAEYLKYRLFYYLCSRAGAPPVHIGSIAMR